MRALGAVEGVGGGVGLGLVGGRVAVWVGDAGGLAFHADDLAVGEGEDGDEADGYHEDVACCGSDVGLLEINWGWRGFLPVVVWDGYGGHVCAGGGGGAGSLVGKGLRGVLGGLAMSKGDLS